MNLAALITLPLLRAFVLLPMLIVGCAERSQVKKAPAESPVSMLAQLTSSAELTSQRPESVAAHMMKTCYWLAEVCRGDLSPAEALTGLGQSPLATETAAALVRNLKTLEDLGCLDEAGRARLKNGEAPIIRTGPHTGNAVSVLHTISPSRVSDLANQVFNLEFVADPNLKELPPEHQLEFARRWHWQGLLDDRGYAVVIYAFPSRGAGK